MYRHRWSRRLATVVVGLMMVGCGGNNGSAGPAPNNVSAAAGDSQATIIWTSIPGVYDWLWLAQSATGVIIGTSGNATAIKIDVSPPYVVAGLTNGLPYSFAINGHMGNPNGPGGPQSNSVTVTARLAGAAWTACSTNCPASGTTLYGVAFGDNGTLQTDTQTIHTYLAVGSAGAMYTSTDAGNWTALPPQANCTPPSSGALRAADYGWGTFVAVGDSGTICFSGLTSQSSTAHPLVSTPTPSTSSWFKATTNPLTSPFPNLYAVATNQTLWSATAGTHVAVGSGGTVIHSTDGQNWSLSTATSGTTNDLYAVNYNHCLLPNWYWVAVGDNGTILATDDATGVTGWTAVPVSGISTALRGVACTPNSTPSTTPNVPATTIVPLWVAVGDSGVLLNSTDGHNWSVPANFKINGTSVAAFPGNVEKIIFGTQFVAIGDNGAIYTSLDGATWTTQSSNVTSNLYGIAQTPGAQVPNGNFGVVPYGYSAVGAAGMTTFGF
jgi:hypothetical protein